MRALVAVVLLWMASLNVWAQESPVYHPIDRSAWQEAIEDVSYLEKAPEEKIPDVEMPEPDTPIPMFNSTLWRVIAFTLIGALLIFILIRLFGKGLFNNAKVEPVVAHPLSDLDERPMETDLERYLREALTASDYRMAVRIYYLMLLRSLHEKGFITWKKEKTNHDYLRELSAHPSFHKLSFSTLVFEYVWYGDRLLNEAEFKGLQPGFTELLQQLRNKA